MAAPSEQIKASWLDGLERVCKDCGSKMPNLQRDVGQIHRNADGTGWVLCMTCRGLRNKNRRSA